MKTAQYIRQEKARAAQKFDMTWYIPETAAARDAELRAENKRFLAWLDLGHVYVVEFTSGVVKVGKTVDPPARIATHQTLARAHGGDIRDSWVSRKHYHCGRTEKELIVFCLRIGQLAVGREYFHVPFAEVRGRASLLSWNRFTPEMLADDLEDLAAAS